MEMANHFGQYWRFPLLPRLGHRDWISRPAAFDIKRNIYVDCRIPARDLDIKGDPESSFNFMPLLKWTANQYQEPGTGYCT